MPPAPSVLLLHTLPSGASHFDWLTARSPAIGAPLLALRTALRPDLSRTAAFSATLLPDHRPLYLTHQGPLEPRDGLPRGDVRRLAAGAASIDHESPDLLVISADWGAGPRRYTAQRRDQHTWAVTVTSQPLNRR